MKPKRGYPAIDPFQAARELFEAVPEPVSPAQQRKKDEFSLRMLRDAAEFHEWRVAEGQPVTNEGTERYQAIKQQIKSLSDKLGV